MKINRKFARYVKTEVVDTVLISVVLVGIYRISMYIDIKILMFRTSLNTNHIG